MTTLREHARGKWSLIITEILGEQFANSRKHGPCPGGGGRDRYRFSDKTGTGSYFCACSDGSKDGFDLLQCACKWSFAEAAAAVEAVIGKPDQPAEERPASWAQKLRGQTIKIQRSKYLESRGLEVAPGLEWIHRLPYLHDGEKLGDYPAMLAPVYRDGKFLTYHVTYLSQGAKAPVPAPRKILPGPPLSGGACQLYPAAPEMGIAEGIETAIAAKMLTGIPTWAALNTSLMSGWSPPQGTKRVHIFADHDRHYAGHAAAYALAHRLVLKGIEVELHIPEEPGDWNDVLLKGGNGGTQGQDGNYQADDRGDGNLGGKGVPGLVWGRVGTG
jgi:putative DNA primase/helicase